MRSQIIESASGLQPEIVAVTDGPFSPLAFGCPTRTWKFHNGPEHEWLLG